MLQTDVRILWRVLVHVPVNDLPLEILTRDFGIQFFGFSRETESIVGHRILQERDEELTVLRVRRSFDAPVSVVEIVSSSPDSSLAEWEQLADRLSRLLVGLVEPGADVLVNALDLAALLLRAAVAGGVLSWLAVGVV